jgi:hypothetical protein
MSQLPPANPTPEGTTPAPYEPAFETAVQGFWAKNRQGILVACVVVLVAIAGRELWQYVAAGREESVRAEYAKADQAAKLEAFASANSGHALAGVASLRVADEKFAATDYKAAAAAYQKAAGNLKNPTLLGRARLGAAVSQLNGGDQAGAEAALKAVTAEAALDKGVRAEAGYHLATLAADAGKADEVKKLAEEVSKIDGTSIWAQRATMLAVRQPGAAKPAETAAPGLIFKPGGE